MRAVVLDRIVRLDPNYPAPAPGAGECLVQVSLAGICGTDLHLVAGYMGFRGVLGHEMVGTVVQGSAQWRGKRVVAEINCVCGRCDMCAGGLANHCRARTVMGIVGRDGCFAEFVAVPEFNLHEVPGSLSDEEAVFVEPLAAAYQIVTQCQIDSRSHVSIVGCGRLGLLVAQVLAKKGCRLSAIGRNPVKLELCEKKGVQAIHVDELVLKKDRDLVVECTGSPRGLELAFQLVRPRGTIVLKSTYPGAGPDLTPAVVDEITIVGSRCGPFREAINALVREAVDVRSLISRTFPIEQAPAALAASREPSIVKVLLRVAR